MGKYVELGWTSGMRLGDRLKIVCSMLCWKYILDCELIINHQNRHFIRKKLSDSAYDFISDTAITASGILLNRPEDLIVVDQKFEKEWDGHPLSVVKEIQSKFENSTFDVMNMIGWPIIHFQCFCACVRNVQTVTNPRQ